MLVHSLVLPDNEQCSGGLYDQESDNYKMLLAHAFQLIEESGLNDLSIRKLAIQANVSTGFLSNYFKSKDELIDALIDSFYQEHLHDKICTLSMDLSFIEYFETLYDILQSCHLDLGIQKIMYHRYQDHFIKGLTLILASDTAIDKNTWSQLSIDDVARFICNHLLFELTSPQPQFIVLKTMIETYIYKEKNIL